jgi:hypothetical protein
MFAEKIKSNAIASSPISPFVVGLIGSVISFCFSSVMLFSSMV